MCVIWNFVTIVNPSLLHPFSNSDPDRPYGFRAYTHEKDSHLLPEIETSINSFVNGKKKPKDVNIACIVGYVPEMVNKFRLYIAIPNRAKDVRDANLNKNRNFNAYRKRVHKVCEATGKWLVRV